jgi:hypothetical protein
VDFFASFQDALEDVLKKLAGRRWKRKDWPIKANGELVNALDGNWAPIEKKLGDKLKQKAEAKGESRSPMRFASGDARFRSRIDDDPRLSHARPSSCRP